jgi:acetyltransferase
LASDLPEIRELDLNPLMVSAQGTLALDIRVRAGRSHPSADDGTRSLRPPVAP